MKENMIDRLRIWSQKNPVHLIQWVARLRFVFLIWSLVTFTMLSAIRFEGVNFDALVVDMQQKIPLLRIMPGWLVAVLITFTHLQYARHSFAPLAAVSLVFIAGTFYVRNVYELPRISSAFHYLFSSMFGLFYLQIEIDGGKVKKPDDEVNPLEIVGGPGYALIQPGNAVIFKDLRRPSGIKLPQRYFMRPFERIGAIVDTDEQHGYMKELTAITHDGIKLKIKDLNFRYRLISEKTEDGKKLGRTPQNPYPFSTEAMEDMAYNYAVSERGADTWQQGVQRAITGELMEFVNKNNLDYLTAPRMDGQEPRKELRIKLIEGNIRTKLKKLGTELLWIDSGNFDIEEFEENKELNVDNQRFAYWASRWVGNDRMIKAVGDAQRMAFQEKGRAEAQAELLRNIAESLKGFDLHDKPANNLRKLLLVRTAQILEGMRDVKSWKR